MSKLFVVIFWALAALGSEFARADDILKCDFTIHRSPANQPVPYTWNIPVSEMTGGASLNQAIEGYQIQVGVQNHTLEYSSILDQEKSIIAESIFIKHPIRELSLSLTNRGGQWVHLECKIQ